MTSTAFQRRSIIGSATESDIPATEPAPKARLLRIPYALLGPKLLNELRTLLHLAEPAEEEPSSSPLLTSDR